MKHTSTRNKLSVLALVLSALVVGGCSPESDNQPVKDPSLQGVASVSFPSVSTTDFDGSPVTRADGSVEKETISYNEGEEQGFMIEAQKGSTDQKAPQTRAIGNMATNTRYRVVIYKDADYSAKKIYKQQQYQAGYSAPVSGTDILLFPGKYWVFAYSFNTTSDLPELAGSSINVNDGQDFITTDVTELTISANQLGTNVSYALAFKRRCCNIWVKVESALYDNTAITSCTVTLNNLPSQASYTVGGAVFSSIGSAKSKAFITNASGKPSVQASAICIPGGSRALSMNYYFQTNAGGFNGQKTYSKTNQPLPSTNFLPGNQYLFQMKGLGAYTINTPSAKIGDNIWASANQSGNNKNRVSNPWNHGYYYTFSDSRSACPDGKHPSSDQFSNLAGKPAQSGTRVIINGVARTVANYGWANGYCIFRDGNQILCLPAQGSRFNTSGSYGEDNVGTSGTYWSGTPWANYGYRLIFNSGACSVDAVPNQPGHAVRCLN